MGDDLFGGATEAATGEQPVIVIDADEPLAPTGVGGELGRMRPLEPRGPKKPRFFGLRRGKKQPEGGSGAGWFSDAPRDFDWN